MHDHIDRILVPRERIAQRVGQLARQIAADYAGRGLTIAALMKGSVIFVADLIRELPLMMKIHLVGISSYAGRTTVGGDPRLLGELPEDLVGQNVLVVDDILDSGRTLALISERLHAAGVAEVRTCVLLRKPEARREPGGMRAADYVGFDIEDEFVVGYGLDYGDFFRNLPDIAVLKELALHP